MAVILQMTYSKKLGLPNFSSHSCSVSLQVEIADISQVTGEAKRLYALMQDSVDREIQGVGYLPDPTAYGMLPSESGRNVGGQNGNGNHRGSSNGDCNGNGAWNCSDKQRELIEKIVREKDLDKHQVEALAHELFDKGVKQLNRLQASGLIDELLERYGGTKRGSNRGNNRDRFRRETRGGVR
jgi:hypothetical protein